MIETHPMQVLSNFYVPWLAAAAAAAPQPSPAPNVLHLDLGDGFVLPLIQAVLVVAGVMMARPIAPRREPPLGRLQSFLVTMIMTIAGLLWVVETKPSYVYAFVMAIGLGFSGFALIELAGQELLGVVKQFFSGLRTRIATIMGTKE